MTQVSKWYWAARERLRTVFFRNRAESEMSEEVRFHLDMEAEKLTRTEGLTPIEARRRAGVAFGGVERFKEDVREARGLDWLASMRLDFVLGLRMLAKYPALTLVGGLGIAVGVAVSVGFFAFVGTHVTVTLPLDEGDRIVALENRDVEIDNEERRSIHDFVLWRRELRSVEQLGAFRNVGRNLVVGDGLPEPVVVAEMTAAGFRVARVAPLLGRYLVEDDERSGAPPVLVIGHDVWQRRFAADSSIVGREVRFGRTVHTIVGVMPEGFEFPQNHQYWVPLKVDPTAYARREGPGIFIFGRLTPGVTMEEAQAELAAIGRRTATEFPKTHAKLRPMVMPYVHSLTDVQGITRWQVFSMQFMMSLLLVVVALNVAVLVYARTAMRQGEIAVRTALGASRRRIVAQLFVEALVLSMLAGAVGLAIAHVGIRLGNGILETELGTPFWSHYSLRPGTVLFTIAVAVFAAVIVGVLPALQATGRRVQADLRQLGGGTGLRLGKTWTALIVAQVAIAAAGLPAAVGAGWAEIRTFVTRPTYPVDEFLMASLRPEPATELAAGADARAQQSRFGAGVTELLRRLEAEPEVAGATFVASLPDRTGPVEVEGVPAPVQSPRGHRVIADGVGPHYLELYDARIVAGRGFGPGDMDSTATAVIVDRAFVRQVMGGGNALGRHIRYAANAADSARGGERGWYEIVGVVEDLQVNELDPTLVRPHVYYPIVAAQAQELWVRVRASATPSDFAPRLRAVAVSIDPDMRLGMTYSADYFERQNQLAVRLTALILGLILLCVFLLSAAGVYALTSVTVTRRRREIGIRSALGAQPRQVLLSVFARVTRQIGLGLAVGLAAAALTTAGASEAMGGRAWVLIPAFGVIMGVVALLGALGPARRGLRIQPTEALRGDG